MRAVQPADTFRGAQYDLVVRGSGFLSIVGALVALALAPLYPPTVQIGAFGWLVIPLALASIASGAMSLTLRRRPSATAIQASSFLGIVQIALLLWLAGGGKAPYAQLLLLPTLGAAFSQPVERCALVLTAAALAAFSPLLYSHVEVLPLITEMVLLSVMTLMTAVVIASTRVHRARLKDASEQANVLAHVDQLTGMPNRRAFDEALVEAIDSARTDDATISLLLCDVDSFKDINDTFGHTAGDDVLQSIAGALTDAVRKPDAAFRWAGDEFAVILRNSDAAGANRVAGRLREAVAQHCRRPDGRPIAIGTGVAELNPAMTADDVLVSADRALLFEKTHRKHLRSVG